MSLIEARFSGVFGAFRLDAAFAVPDKGVTAIFGPSGSGKTTLLQCIAGVTRVAAGRMIAGGAVWQDETAFLPPYRRRIGYVFQGANLFAHLSVEDNLRYGLKRRRGGDGAIDFAEVIDMLGLADLLPRRPDNLSGGERQRVAIGRALLANPRLLVMDEPLTGLDQAARSEILGYLEKLRDRLAAPVLYVSHDLGEVIRLAEIMVLMAAGRVVSVGTVAESLTRLDLPLAAAADASSLLAAAVSGHDADNGLCMLDVPGGQFLVPATPLAIGEPVRLRVFASDVALSREDAAGTTILNRLPARIVTAQESAPHQITALLRLGNDGEGVELLARITRKSWAALGFQPNESVWALVKAVSLAV